jgi:Family of unknown function (DUF6113)
MSGSDPRAVTVGAYVALFLLGLLQGLIGTFQYSRGPAPLAAILFDLGILATCVLGSRGMRSALGGVLPAAGWFVMTLLLSSVSAGGSVLITDTSAGRWFLFGGAVCAAAGGVYAFAMWSRVGRDYRGPKAGGGRSGPVGGPAQRAAPARPTRRSGR